MTELVESGILTRRVKAARLKVASIQDRAQKQQQEDRVRVVVQRIREVRQELAFQKGFRELLQQEGVQVRPIPKRLKDKAVNDKKNLRTAATRLRNPDVQVVDVADSNSVVKALDVAQETFIKAYKALKNFRGESAFYTWLYRIAINTAKNYLVARSKRPPDRDLDFQDLESDTELRDLETPENSLHRDEMFEVMTRTLEQLPEELRVALTLRELEGMSYDEISEVMGCPIGTVRSRIHRAREAIDNELKPMLSN